MYLHLEVLAYHQYRLNDWCCQSMMLLPSNSKQLIHSNGRRNQLLDSNKFEVEWYRWISRLATMLDNHDSVFHPRNMCYIASMYMSSFDNVNPDPYDTIDLPNKMMNMYVDIDIHNYPNNNLENNEYHR